MILWAKHNFCMKEICLMTLAAENDHLDVLIWLKEQGCKFGAPTYNAAAKNGHLEILIWLINNGCKFNLDYERVVKEGHLNIIKHFCDEATHFKGYVCKYAA